MIAAAMLLLTSCGKVETNETPKTENENISITSTEENIETEEEIVIEEEEEEIIEEEETEEGEEYILNTNSYKIHFPWCHSVDRMKEYNKNESIFIGDQFMTDILGAKRSGFKIILVNRLLDKEPIVTKFWRFFEKRIIKGEQIYYIWQYEFTNPLDYNSIHLVKSGRYRILKK